MAITTFQIISVPIVATNIAPIVYTAGATVMAQIGHTAQRVEITYAQVLGLKISPALPAAQTIRISFDYWDRGVTPDSYMRIFRNAGAVGTEKHTTSGAPANWSEDIAGWGPGDTIELHVKVAAGAGHTGCVKNLIAHGTATPNFVQFFTPTVVE